jgi:cytolysin (calcineurin-like family phosphatase)
MSVFTSPENIFDDASQRRIFNNAISYLLSLPALKNQYEGLRKLASDLQDEALPLSKLEDAADPALARLIAFQVVGLFNRDDSQFVLQRSQRDSGVTIRAQVRTKATADTTPPANLCNAGVTTFIFLADPQPNSADPDHPDRVKNLSTLNSILNNISSLTWPSGFGLSCEGQLIGDPNAVFFGGDMCQTGGNYSASDQFVNQPATYTGGWELQRIRELYEPGYKVSDGLTKINIPNVFFGLGNHDIQDDDQTAQPAWHGDCIWDWYSPSDFWRYQMWDFICQMHTGLWERCVHFSHTDAVIPVTSIDSSNYSYDWTNYSFNYVVDMGPVDVYQLHRYGGDGDYGRADGLAWVINTMKSRGVQRPSIVVQHYCFDDVGPYPDPNWNQEERDYLLTQMAPFNVIAFLTGHVHEPYTSIPFQIGPPNSQILFDCFRPGSCGCAGNFALVRVSATTFDLMQATTTSGQLEWSQGYSKSIPPPTLPAPNSALACFGVSGSATRLYYLDVDSDVHELAWDGRWFDNDISAQSNARGPAATGSALACFGVSGSATRLYYLDVDSEVHQLAWGGGTWSDDNLSATSNAGPAASGSALACFGVNGSGPRVYYLDVDSEVHQLAWGGSTWSDDNLSATSNAGPAASGSALACFGVNGSDPRVYYLDSNSEVHELAWNDGIWRDSVAYP